MKKINEIVVQSGLKETESRDIMSNFTPIKEALDVLSDECKPFLKKVSEDNITDEVVKEARQYRLRYKSLRVQNDKIHKKVKEKTLSISRVIDGVRNVFKHDIKNTEEQLQQIENHFELVKQKEKDELQERRVQEIQEYIDESSITDFTNMNEEVWTSFVEAQKQSYKRKLEEEKLDKERLLAEQKKLEEAKQENDRLKAESLKKEQELKKLKQKQLEAQSKSRAEQEKLKKETQAKEFEEFLSDFDLVRSDIDDMNYKIIESEGNYILYKSMGVFKVGSYKLDKND